MTGRVDVMTPARPWLHSDGSRVQGAPLVGDLAAILSLDDHAMPARRALVAMAYHLRTACLVGNPAPIVAGMSDRLRNSTPGDLVTESTSGWYATSKCRGDWHRGIGVLLLQRAERTAEDGPTDNITYVQYGPSVQDVCRWGNCEFMVIPWDGIVDWHALARRKTVDQP